MAVYLLIRIPVERSELVHEVLARLLVVIGRAMVVGEAVLCYWAPRKLLLEEIGLVEEDDEGRFGEPVGIGDRLPEHEGLVHLVLVGRKKGLG